MRENIRELIEETEKIRRDSRQLRQKARRSVEEFYAIRDQIRENIRYYQSRKKLTEKTAKGQGWCP